MTSDREFSWSMSVITGRKQSLSRSLCGRCAFRNPEVLYTDADVWRLSDFSMDGKKTHGSVLRSAPPENAVRGSDPKDADASRQIYYKEEKQVAVKEKIRVRLKSYDHTLIDAAAEKIVDVAKRNGAAVSGPIPLPTEKEIVTILRAVHKYKDSREQFEMRTHKRLIDIVKPSQKVVDALMSVELPAGVEIEVKI